LHFKEYEPIAREYHKKPEEQTAKGMYGGNEEFDNGVLTACLDIIRKLGKERPNN
jgi:hypothetical protein